MPDAVPTLSFGLTSARHHDSRAVGSARISWKLGVADVVTEDVVDVVADVVAVPALLPLADCVTAIVTVDVCEVVGEGLTVTLAVALFDA